MLMEVISANVMGKKIMYAIIMSNSVMMETK